MLEEELQYFIDNQDELVKQYNGKYLILKGKNVLGAYPSLMEAYTFARKNYTPGTVMLQRCIPGEDAYTVTITSNVLAPC